MNELRMYVEHLFEGRVLTAEMIELKEEIYGNLVARYEDLIAQGVDVEVALEQAKASFMDIEDVLEEESRHDEGEAEEAFASDREEATDSRPATPLMTAQNEKNNPVGNLTEKKRPSALKVVLIVIAAIFVIGCVAIAACGAVAFKAFDSASGFTSSSSIKISDDEGNGISIQRGDAGVTVGGDGSVRIDGEPADNLAVQVVNAQSGDVAPYTGTTVVDSLNVGWLLRALPMGDVAAYLNADLETGALSVSYRGIPDTYDDDSVDLALAYDATVLMAVLPDLEELHLTVTEGDDLADEDRYVFTRAALERTFGIALTEDLVSESGWRQIKEDNLYKHDFAEDLVDAADRD